MIYARGVKDLLCNPRYADANGTHWTKDDREGLRAWMGSFLDWWLTSVLGQSSRALKDNIGTAYTISVVAMANYTGEAARAASVVRVDSLRHVAQQIAPDGSIPCEDAPNLQFSFGCKCSSCSVRVFVR